MNRSTTVFLVNSQVRAFSAYYEDGGKMEVFKTFDKDLKKDDLMVVTSKTRHGFTVVKVNEPNIAVDIQDTQIEVRWAISKLDLTEHNEIVKNEAGAIEAVKMAEFNKMRRDLMDNIVGPDADAIRALPIYKNGTSVPDKPAA